MQEYVIELSKYFIAFFMVLYTASCFYTFRYPVGEKHRGVFILQDLLMFLVQVLCFLNLSLVSGDFQYLFFFAFILIFLFATITMVSLIYENINRLLLNNMCMLLGIGLCIVSRLSFDKAIRQYVIVLVSLIFSLLVPYLLGKIHFFKKITWLYATLGIALLSTVLILGEVTHGSKISFSLGGITFQPSEFVKILFLFFLAGALWENVSFQRVVLTAIIAGAHVVILVVSKDLGSALIFFVGFVFVVLLPQEIICIFWQDLSAEVRLLIWRISCLIMYGSEYWPGRIPGNILTIKAIRSPSHYLPSAVEAGSAWDC